MRGTLVCKSISLSPFASLVCPPLQVALICAIRCPSVYRLLCYTWKILWVITKQTKKLITFIFICIATMVETIFITFCYCVTMDIQNSVEYQDVISMGQPNCTCISVHIQVVLKVQVITQSYTLPHLFIGFALKQSSWFASFFIPISLSLNECIGRNVKNHVVSGTN